MSLRARLVAAALALVVCGLGAADVATYSALRAFLLDRVDVQVGGARTAVERLLPALRFGPGGRFAQESLQQLGATVPGVYVELRGLDNDPLLVVRRPDAPDAAPRLPDDTVALLGASPDADASRLLTLPSVRRGDARYRVEVSAITVPGPGVLVVAVPLTDTIATLHRLVLIEVLVTLVVFALAGLVGWWLVRLGLRPLGAIEETAVAITGGDMTPRVTNDDDRTEVGRLGRVLNVMLDRLDRALRERTASEEAARISEHRMRRFVADASHELRTPVAAVRAYAELYRLGADQRPADLARLLARIEQEAARMGVLVDDLLLLTRLDEGRALERAPVDLGAVAADAVAAARAVEPDRPIDLEVDGSVEVLGDRDRLRQVIDNLLANVRSHTPEGAPAGVHVGRDGDGAFVDVADRGLGLDDDTAAHIFERFYRADPARSRDHGGAGLGLSIVAAIAAAHDGEAMVRTREGGGTVFRVRLPSLEGDAA